MKNSSLPAWLESAVLYNIYPQSFHDSNGDGIGDLEGIRQKLPYIRDLGVTAIWLNPIYPSPFRDAGYDVSDYCAIAPRYGTMGDFDRLLEEAHGHGLKLLLDFVPGHTSDQHPWFQESAQPERNPHSDWYIWTRDGFGPSEPDMVRGYSDRVGHYKPNFFYFQPALNYGYANPDPAKTWQQPVNAPGPRAVRAEMKRIMAFWLDKGVDGFRVDMAACLVKDDTDNKENEKLWREVRRWMDRAYPGRVLISEWSWPTRSIQSGFHLDFMIHFNNEAYNSLFRFENGRNIFPSNGHSVFDRKGLGDFKVFLKHYLPFLRDTQSQGFISMPTGNHDLPRLNHGRTTDELKVAFTFLFTQAGVPTLYYGDEIGMRNLDQVGNKEGGYNRTPARTPMQWTDGKNAGFSDASAMELYLPVDRGPDAPNVAQQEHDPLSLLHFTRGLLKLRAENPALRTAADFRVLSQPDTYPIAILRRGDGQSALILLNPTGQRRFFTFPARLAGKAWQPILLHRMRTQNLAQSGEKKLTCPPCSSAIWVHSAPERMI